MFALRTLGITFVVALASVCLSAQTPAPPDANPENSAPPRTGSITGQVVDENGRPLPNAVIQLRAANSNVIQIANTDREGQFQINGLEPLEYGVTAWKPAYLLGSIKSPRPSNKFRIGDRIALTLNRGGVVSGKVTNANGDPVVLVNVRVQMVRFPDGRNVDGAFTEEKLTDDRGIYRIYGLREGTYVVSAGGPNSSPSSESVFEFDVPTYAPGSSRENASEISVRMGEEVADVDIRYRAEPGRVISGDVLVPPGAHAGFAVMLTTGEARFQYGQTFYQSENKRSFIFKGVSDGNYGLMAQSYNPEGDLAISEPKQIAVQGADVTGIQLPTKMLGTVSGRIVLEETKVAECTSKEQPLFTETLVYGWSRNDEASKQIPQVIRSRGEPVRPDDKGNFLIRNLAPGAYRFGPSLRARQWYVQSITFGPKTPETTAPPKVKPVDVKQVDATRVWTNIKLGDRLSGLTITLAQGGAALHGAAEMAPGERPPVGAVLYLVPVEREKSTDLLRYFAAPVDRSGYFDLSNIAPGRYWVLGQTVGGDEASLAKVRLPNETEFRAQIRRAAEAAKTEIELKPCQDLGNFKLTLKTQN